jgi:O-antigen ligase
MLLNLLGQNAHFIGRARYFFWVRHYTLTLRLGLIGLCLVATAVSALLIAERGPVLGMLPVILILAVAGFLFVYYNFALMLLLTLVVSTVLRLGIGTGTGTPITLTFLLLMITPAIWLFKMAFVERSLNVRRAPANLPALLFMLTVVFATFWSGMFVDDEVRYLFADKVNPRLMSALSMILSVATYFMFANHIRSILSMKFFVGWFIFIGGLMLVLRLAGGVPLPLNDGGQFSAWVVTMALGQALFNQNVPRPLRLLFTAISAAWVYIGIGLSVSWLSGWLPVTLSASVLMLLRSRKLLLLVLVLLIVVAINNPDVISQIVATESAESGVTRTASWDRTFDLLQDHLLFGTGPAGYQFYFTVYIGGLFQLSHNNYIDVLAQTGVVGFFFYLWMWLAIGWMTLRAYRAVPRHGFRYALACSLVAAYAVTLVSMMLGDWVLPFAYTQTIAGIDYTIWHWMMAGMSVALYYVSDRAPVEAEVSRVQPSSNGLLMNLKP